VLLTFPATLLTEVANWRNRPTPDIRYSKFGAANRPIVETPGPGLALYRRPSRSLGEAESTGQPPRRFVYGLRLEWAKEFLLDPSRTATEVALDCGFSHAQHCSTAFKKATDVTPSDVRRASMR
jgi:hypothetical protein